MMKNICDLSKEDKAMYNNLISEVIEDYKNQNVEKVRRRTPVKRQGNKSWYLFKKINRGRNHCPRQKRKMVGMG